MKRVSSRQRLVSWDAFDASRDGSELSDSEYSDNDHQPEVLVATPPQPTCTSPVVGKPSKTAAPSVLILPEAESATATLKKSHLSSESLSETSSLRDSTWSSKSTMTTASPVAAPINLRSQRRKRGRRKQHGPPAVIPSFSWEIEASSSPRRLSLEDLNVDVQFHLFSFLDMTSLRSVSAMNHKFRELVQSDEATLSVWKLHITTKWPMMSNIRMGLMDSFSLPIAAAAATSTGSDDDDDNNNIKVNIPLLLSLTPNALPSEVDETLLDHPRRRALLLRTSQNRRITRHLMRAPMPTKLQVYRRQQPQVPVNGGNAPSSSSSSDTKQQQSQHSLQVLIRYTGPIGSGDRCIRGNHPLPRPTRKTTTWTRPKFLQRNNDTNNNNLLHHPNNIGGQLSTGDHHQQHHSGGSLFEMICQGARAVSRRGGTLPLDWKPFVSPYLQKDGCLDVTPRMVAYYEVEILNPSQENGNAMSANDDDNEDDDESMTALPPPPQRHTNASECVAVGIATESFHVHSRMPGWDSMSFGYHGDDGGIFHSSGGMVERFGPTFGTGDVVGCGIDYVAQGIFFTLNGEFLGYGWKNIGTDFLQNDLYPVVGIDTNSPVALNFGTIKPFQYDLTDFNAQHAKYIEPQYQFANHYHKSRPRLSLASCGRNGSNGSLSSRFSRRSSSKR